MLKKRNFILQLNRKQLSGPWNERTETKIK